jgi:hypothetical protein
MGRGVRYLHGPVGFITHLYDIRWDAESAIYTVPLALPRIFMMSDGARSTGGDHHGMAKKGVKKRTRFWGQQLCQKGAPFHKAAPTDAKCTG